MIFNPLQSFNLTLSFPCVGDRNWVEFLAHFLRASGMATPEFHIVATGEQLQAQVCDFVVARARKAIEDHGHFSVGLSGGSLAKVVSQGLRERGDVDWSKWHVFYCDERLVPFDSEDSTHAYIKRELLERVPVSPENVRAIDPTLDATAAAEDYAAKIRQLYPEEETAVPRFDLLLLGMGPDGHTCSLFPGHPGLTVSDRIVIPITDSPKPPPTRITLTLPVLNAARCSAVVSTGGSKAEAVKGSLEPGEGEEPLPAGMVRPTEGELHWFLDEPAAAKLNKKT